MFWVLYVTRLSAFHFTRKIFLSFASFLHGSENQVKNCYSNLGSPLYFTLWMQLLTKKSPQWHMPYSVFAAWWSFCSKLLGRINTMRLPFTIIRSDVSNYVTGVFRAYYNISERFESKNFLSDSIPYPRTDNRIQKSYRLNKALIGNWGEKDYRE